MQAEGCLPGFRAWIKPWGQMLMFMAHGSWLMVHGSPVPHKDKKIGGTNLSMETQRKNFEPGKPFLWTIHSMFVNENISKNGELLALNLWHFKKACGWRNKKQKSSSVLWTKKTVQNLNV